jgi:hypothetical protein
MNTDGGLNRYTSMNDVVLRAPTWILNTNSMVGIHVNSTSTWGDYHYKTWAFECFHKACISTLDVLNAENVASRIDEEEIQYRLERYYQNEIEIMLEEHEDDLEEFLAHYGFRKAINYFRDERERTCDITVERLVYEILQGTIEETYIEDSSRYPTFIHGTPPPSNKIDLYDDEPTLTCGECFICKEDECLLVKLPCNHEVGRVCLITWMVKCQDTERPPHCPLCRAVFRC